MLEYQTWNDFERACGRSRMYGGTHFADAIEEVGIEVQNITNSANF